MSDPSSKPTINIPAGNSPVTPEPTGPVAPTRYLHGSEPSPDDYKAAIASIKPVQDFRTMATWPCVREALLYGIGGGSAIGAIRFIGSRGVKSAANWAVLAFCGISMATKFTCDQARAKELAQMRMIQEKFPHRHVSNLKRKDGDWTPPPSDTAEGK